MANIPLNSIKFPGLSDTYIIPDTDIVAETYSSGSTYAVGDYCIYNNALYRCSTAITTAEAWTAGHWTAVAMANEVSQLNADLTELEKATLISDTASGAIASFPDGAEGNASAVVASIEPVQSGSGDPSPDNVRPISGWTGANVVRTGINVWDEEWENGYISSSGVKISHLTNIVSKNYICIDPTATYYCAASNSVYVYLYDANYSPLGFVSGNVTNKTFTSPYANAKYMLFYCSSTETYNHDISINYPSTDHDYHAYNGSSVSVDWTTEAGTVYGGSLNVTTGVLTVDKAYENVPLTNFAYSSSINAMIGYAPYGYLSDAKRPSSNSVALDAIADCITINSASAINGGTDGFGLTYDGNIYLRSGDLSSKSEYTSAFADGINVCYALAEPTTITLTPQEVSILAGDNNIWADTGDISVTYPCDTKAFILKKIAEALA